MFTSVNFISHQTATQPFFQTTDSSKATLAPEYHTPLFILPPQTVLLPYFSVLGFSSKSTCVSQTHTPGPVSRSLPTQPIVALMTMICNHKGHGQVSKGKRCMAGDAGGNQGVVKSSSPGVRRSAPAAVSCDNM